MHTELYTYIRTLASLHPDLFHTPEKPSFFGSLGEANNALSGQTFRLPCLVVVGYDFPLANSPDALFRHVALDLMVLDQVGTNDFSKLHEVWQRTYTICNKLVSRIQWERSRYVPGVGNNFELLGTRFEQIGPVLNSHFGHELHLLFKQPHVLNYEPDTWGDWEE